jgi:hypothetical protein
MKHSLPSTASPGPPELQQGAKIRRNLCLLKVQSIQLRQLCLGVLSAQQRGSTHAVLVQGPPYFHVCPVRDRQ